MPISKQTDFGKEVKKKLIDIDRNQTWLIEKVKEKTGLYFDSSYLCKILNGTLKTTSITTAICEVLDISMPDE